MDPRRSLPYLPLIAILLGNALLQAIVIARAPTISADGIIFVSIARDVADDPIAAFRQHDQHPGYPAMLLASERVAQWLGYREQPDSWLVAALAVNFVCGVLSVAVVWFFARDLFGDQVANVAALIFAVLPVPRCNVADAQSDTPHVLLYLLAAWLASSGMQRQQIWRLALAGAASGLAYWLRPEGLEVALIALACLMGAMLRGAWTWRQACAGMAALGITAFVVAAPYPILAGKITSKQLPFAKISPPPTYLEKMAVARAEAKAHAAAPPVETRPAELKPAEAKPAETNPSETSQPREDKPTEVASTQPAPDVAAPDSAVASSPPAKPQRRYSLSFLAWMGSKAFNAFINSICQGFKFVFIPFYLLGNIELIRRKPQWLPIAFIALLGLTHILILHSVYVLSGYIAHRHVLPIVGLAMPFTALGIFYVARHLARPFDAPPLAVTAGVLAIAMGLVLPYTLRPMNREFIPVIAATHWVENHAGPGAGIVSNSPYVEFYGTMPVAYLGTHYSHSVDDALTHTKHPARYDYVVLHVNAHDYHPEWLDQVTTRYRQVQMFDDPYSSPRPKKVLVFEAKDRRLTQAKTHAPS